MARLDWVNTDDINIQQQVLIAYVSYETLHNNGNWIKSTGFTEIARYNKFRKMMYEIDENNNRTSIDVLDIWGDDKLISIDIKPPIEPSAEYPCINIQVIDDSENLNHKIVDSNELINFAKQYE